MISTVTAKGSLKLELKNAEGIAIHTQEVDNLVVNTGLAFIAQRLAGTPTAMSHMGVGMGGTAAAATQTDLILTPVRVALTSSTNVTTTVTNDSMQYVATFPAGTATGALVEAGIFNAASAGTMLCRTVFAAINKAALDSLTITWTVKFA
jgi:hypothetical protein